jgi:Flp pilus assembly protein TadG
MNEKPSLSKRERGQALILIALAFVGLASFVGLAVDAGILFTQVGHLRRAVDAAALAAANQFREGRSASDIERAADEFVQLNSINPTNTSVFVCGTHPITGQVFFPSAPPAMQDNTLCPDVGDPPRKFVRVTSRMPVDFAFLPIIGFTQITISANAISEAASIDLVLAIDNSSSMAYDLCDNGWDDDGEGGGGALPPGNPELDDCNGVPDPDNRREGAIADADVPRCNLNRFLTDPDPGIEADLRRSDCHPFEEVRDASLALLSRVRFPYDRMAVVTFANLATEQISLQAGTNAVSVGNVLNAMEVVDDPPVGVDPCHLEIGDARGCTNTNTAEGLRYAGNQFGLYKRDEAVWIVILLSDGGANAALQTGGSPPPPNLPAAWVCPGGTSGMPTWIQPFCRDIEGSTRHSPSTDPAYDADDAARDMADFVGCPDSTVTQPAGCASTAPGGQGAVIFSIGLGRLMTDSQACDTYYGGACEPDLGEQLMRYVAAVGDDNNPGTNPCSSTPTGQSCGNYYFSPTGSGLMEVFEAIASRIFTRITH